MLDNESAFIFSDQTGSLIFSITFLRAFRRWCLVSFAAQTCWDVSFPPHLIAK